MREKSSVQVPAAIDRPADRDIGPYPARSAMAPRISGPAKVAKAGDIRWRPSCDRAEAKVVCTGGHAAGKIESGKNAGMCGPAADLRGRRGQALEAGGQAVEWSARPGGTAGSHLMPPKMNEMNSRLLRYECVAFGEEYIQDPAPISEMNKFDT